MLAIFSNDDVGGTLAAEGPAQFRTVVSWLDSLGLHGTFFWIPEPPRWEEAHRLWRDTLEWAQSRGHDFQLHGLAHDSCLEFGLPQASTRRANPAPFEEYERHRMLWERRHQAARLQEKLVRGLWHYEQLFGGRPVIFRAPCFGVSRGMYEALYAVGLFLSSSRGINPTATAYALGYGGPAPAVTGRLGGDNLSSSSVSLRQPQKPPADSASPAEKRAPHAASANAPSPPALDDLWQPDFPCVPWREPPGVWEIPCMEDLCIGGVTPAQYEERLALVLSELAHCLKEAQAAPTPAAPPVLLIGSHYAAMLQTWEQTRSLLEAIFEWLARQGVTKWITFAEYAEIVAAESPRG